MNTPTINQVKAYWDNRPCNVRHSDKPIGTKEYFDEVEYKKLFVEPHILTFTNFNDYRNKSVLEIGCGIGTAAVNFARNGCNYTGLELSLESLNLTKQRFGIYGLYGDFYQGDAEQLTSILPKDKKYDLIYSWGVIHHSPNPKQIVDEAKKLLKPDGILKLMVYAKNSWKNFMIEAGYDQPEAQAGCPIAFTYNKDEIPALLGDDMEILSLEQDHIFPYEIEPYKEGMYIKQPYFQAMPEHMFKILEKNLGWHMLINAKLKV